MRWTGAGLAAATALTNVNVNTSGNGDAVSTFNTSGTFTAVIQSANAGVLITGAASSIARFDVARTATKYAVGQVFYTPGEVPGATMAIYTFRSGVNGAAAAGSFVHYTGGTGGKLGFQNAAASTVAAFTTTVDLVLNHEYQIDMVIALDATTPSTTNGRAFYRVKDLTDPTWNTTGDFYYDSGYTINVGTADITQHRIGKVGNNVMNTGFKVRQLGWADLSTVNTSLTRSTAESHFMTPPTYPVSGAVTTMTWKVSAGVSGNAQQEDWKVRAGVSGTTTQENWKVRIGVGDTLVAMPFKILAGVGGNATAINWKVNAGVSGTSNTSMYKVRASIAGTAQQENWKVNASVSGTATAVNFKIRTAVEGTATTMNWHVDSLADVPSAPSQPMMAGLSSGINTRVGVSISSR